MIVHAMNLLTPLAFMVFHATLTISHHAFGRMARHHLVNDILWRAFTYAGIHTTKEPSGLSRIDRKCPDGLTLKPWCGGKQLAWDVTIVNSLAVSYINNVSLFSGGVAEMAAENKITKYANLASSVLFQPVALETLDPFNADQ
jgi:hypothetical protein